MSVGELLRTEQRAAPPELHRAFTPDLEVRSGGDGRTIVGIAVPYNRAQRIDARLVEQFAPAAFRAQLGAVHRVRFAREHVKLGGALIGRTMLLRDDAAGLYGEWRVSRTVLGDETLELIKDGALRELSIGFLEGQNRRLAGGVTERVTATLTEVAVVVQGAYGDGATVAAVRAVDQTGTNAARAAQLLAGLPVLPPVA